MPTVAIDWDDTLVGYKKFGEPGEWLPGSLQLLRQLKRAGFTVVIHSCRATWDAGYIEIKAKLADVGMRPSARLKIHTAAGKPLATLYIDDRGFRFATGHWTPALIKQVLELAA